LVNELSHNSDPTSTIEHKDKSESKDTIKILLNTGKESDPKQYEILEKNTQINKHAGLHIGQFVLELLKKNPVINTFTVQISRPTAKHRKGQSK
jgi:hypothetical protein